MGFNRIWIAAMMVAITWFPPRSGRGFRAETFLPASPSMRSTAGRLVEVKRLSREVTVRTASGMTERIVIPRKAEIHGPHGAAGLSRIQSGMAVRVEGTPDSRGRLVAREVFAR